MSGQHVASTPPLTLGVLRAWKPHVQPAIVLPVLVGATTAGQSRPAPMDWLVAACVGFFYGGHETRSFSVSRGGRCSKS